MMPRSVLILIVLAAQAALGQIGVPSIGAVRDIAGEVRTLAGISGAFVLQPGKSVAAVGGGFSGKLGIWQTGGRLVLIGADGQQIDSRDAASGAVAPAFAAGGASGVVWLAASGELLGFPGWQEMEVPDWRGEPLALSLQGRNVIQAVVRRGGDLWLVQSRRADGVVANARLLPGVKPPVALLPDGTLVHFRDGFLIAEKTDGETREVPLVETPESFECLGSGWLAVRTASGVNGLQVYALEWNRDDGKMILLRLPAAARSQQ